MTEKSPLEKAAAERQSALIAGALQQAKENGGVWLNPSAKTAPRFYPRGVAVSAFNALTLAIHSDQHGYKTNDYTLFSEAKKRGESVQAKEKGVPFNWYNWNEYVSKSNAEEKISREAYQSLTPEQQAGYKGVRTREIRSLFNIDQTTFPFVDKESYGKEVKANGSAEERGVDIANDDKLQIKVNDLILKTRDNLVPIHLDGSGTAHYDAGKDIVYVPSQKNYETLQDYTADLLRQVVTATGSQQRLSRQGVQVAGGKVPTEDAKIQERLITELATGTKLLELGLPAKLSPDSMKMIDHWQRELKENPCLVDIIEADVNNAVDLIHKAERGEKVELHSSRGGQTNTEVTSLPQHFFIADEIKGIPNKDTKEFVVVRDAQAKQADVVLPSGASLEVDNEIPGMNKARIEHALKKEGVENVTFYNVDGSLGYRPDDGYFKDKDVSVAKLNQWKLENVANLDVSEAVNRADNINFDKVLMLKDDEGKWALFLKPENEPSFSIHPSAPDVNRFFSVMKQGQDDTADRMRQELAQKYYTIANNHPELKQDLFKSQATAEELAKIDRVVIFKTKGTEEKPSIILCLPTIQGEKVKPRPVSQQQWQRMWLADDKQDYKMHLAASLFADVLRQGRKDAVAVGTDKTEQEAQSQPHQEAKPVEKQEQEAKQDAQEEDKKGQEKQKEEVKKEEEKKEVKKAALSPMMKQFLDLKGKHPDALLLFRVGDFYETYQQDARKSSQILGITLTRSNSQKGPDGKAVEMAGFPHHALDTYLPKLIRAGQRVAICDQLESPRVTTQRHAAENSNEGKQAVKEEVVPHKTEQEQEHPRMHR